MQEPYRSWLLACDEPGQYEFPASFDAEDVEARARAVEAALRSDGVAGTFESWQHNQDASFGLAILLEQWAREDRGVSMVPVIRFSNFGGLATLTFVEFLPKALPQTIAERLAEEGFRYVPDEVLHVAYDGVMAADTDIPTWWVRYFDFL